MSTELLISSHPCFNLGGLLLLGAQLRGITRIQRVLTGLVVQESEAIHALLRES